jgi:hypothetical protein
MMACDAFVMQGHQLFVHQGRREYWALRLR